MIKYESNFKELRFIAEGVQHKFNNGLFITADKKVLDVLAKLKHARKVEEVEAQPEEATEAPKKRKPTSKAAE